MGGEYRRGTAADMTGGDTDPAQSRLTREMTSPHDLRICDSTTGGSRVPYHRGTAAPVAIHGGGGSWEAGGTALRVR